MSSFVHLKSVDTLKFPVESMDLLGEHTYGSLFPVFASDSNGGEKELRFDLLLYCGAF